MEEPETRNDPAVATSDRLLSGLTADGQVSVRVLDATELVSHAVAIRPMSPTASVALARGLMGALLLVAGKQEGESVQLQARGDGPLGSILAIADTQAHVRGTVSQPLAEAHGITQFINVPAALGRGTLSVVRTHPTWREPYRGVTAMDTGELAQDLTSYLHGSEQVRSAMALSAVIGEAGHLDSAAAYLVQALPGAPDDALEEIETTLRTLPRAAEIVREGGATALLERVCNGAAVSAQSERKPVFFCPCTRERAQRTLLLLGAEELREISESGLHQEVACDFCGRAYEITADELAGLAEQA